MRKAFLAYQYGMANAGDFAINLGSLDLLNEFYEEVTIVSKLTVDDSEYLKNVNYTKKYYPNFNIIEGPFNLNRGSIFTTLYSYVVGALRYPILLSKKSYNEEVEQSDIVFLNGGNILRCNSFTDFVRLYALLFPLKLSKKHGKDYVLLPQSTTSIDDRGKRLLTPFLDNAKVVFAREDISHRILKEIFPNTKICYSLDSAFFIKDRESVFNEYYKKYSGYIDNSTVCVTIRKENLGDMGELELSVMDKIKENILKLIENIVNDGLNVALVIQTQKDREFTEEIYNICNSYKVSIIEEYDPLLLRELYRNSKCLFGMRLHSMILAMSVGTPVIGYFDKRWGNKNPGTLEQFKMPYSFIEDNDELYLLMDTSIKNKELMNIEIDLKKKLVIDTLNEIIAKK